MSLSGIAFQDSPKAWLRDHLPAWMFEIAFLLENWQWLGLLTLILLGLIFERIISLTLQGTLRRILKRTGVEVDAALLAGGTRPFGVLVMALLWLGGLTFLGLPEQVDWILILAARTLAVAAGVWGAYRLVDVLSAYLTKKAQATSSKFDDLLIPLIRKALKVFIAVFGIVFIASNIPDLNISSLLAGLGLGGLAFALAAKDTVSNLFGSVTVILDRPFHVGDWVKIGDVEGTVEEVGFRSTRVRTFYNSLITVPNSTLITTSIDNLGARRFRRWSTTVAVTYNTPPDRIEAFCEGIRELVRRHPYTRKDYFHVWANQFGPASIDILLYVFHETPDWSTELRERHRLLLDIMRLAARLQVEFAFPTQTLYLSRTEALPDPPPFPAKTEVDEVMARGRTEAASIAEGELGGKGVRPPPVAFDGPRSENRGEDTPSED